MRLVLNVLWLVLSGLWLALAYVLLGLVMCVLIVTIPFGIASFRLAGFVIWPFGRALVPRADKGTASTIGNVLWFIFAGFWMAVFHIVTGLALCLTVIGIPLGLGNFKLAAAAIAPLGKVVVPTSDPRASGAIVGF
ncbi:MAG TPA: YccF domain-containing protein [Acidimicrobiales bacterium]|nr:YccF domain-containing protein [Acidimicrobiales bacterium]